MHTIAKEHSKVVDVLRRLCFERTDPSAHAGLEHFDDLVGRECRVTLAVNPGNPERGWEPSNDVKAVKPRSEVAAGSSLI